MKNLFMALLLLTLTSSHVVRAFTVAPTSIMRPQKCSSRLRMAIDYNDPVVAEEFAQVQPMDYDDVVSELRDTGVVVSPSMKCVMTYYIILLFHLSHDHCTQ